MIHINSNQGRIGELWWINSQPSVKIHGAIAAELEVNQ